jgi:hypothetical protein
MLDQLFMADLAKNLADPINPNMPTGQQASVTVSSPTMAPTETAGGAYVGTRLNTPKAGQAQPTQQDREKLAIGLLDSLAGALRGAAAMTVGLPGDIRSIVDMINQEGATKYLGERSFATTEEILKDTSLRVPGTQIDIPFPPVLGAGATNVAERLPTVETAQEVGQFLPAPGIPEAVVKGAKLITKGAKVLGPKASQMTEDYLRSIGGIADIVPVGTNIKAVGEIPAGAPLAIKPITFADISPKSLPIAQKIVSDGIASNMSATKMIQAVEQQTGTKLTGKQQKELKEYVSANVPKGQIYSDQAFKDLVAKPFPFEPSTQRFEKAFNDAINYVKTATPEAIRNIAIQANQRLAPILGVGADGKTKRLLTTNGKLLKTETGIEGGVPIELPDGRNIESAGLAISPAFKASKFSTCPNSASCAQECLGKTSGGYFAYDGGSDLDAMKGTRLRSFRMTQAMFREPEAFAIKLNEEIFSLKKAAEKNGNALAIRLNVLSDIDPKVHKSIIESNPDVLFYDYTKMKYRPVAPNHHYTYSSTGLSQKAGQNGLTVDVDNPHTNWAQMRQWLDDGQNVAMAFSSKKGLPESVLDEATGKIYKVIDGDAYDFRPMDTQPPGFDGVIVGLKNKAMTRKESLAAQDSKGFFVQYDPKLGTEVIIPRQKKEVIMLKTEGQNTPSPMDTGEQITERTAK